jgi:hypothetical protein
MTIMPRPTFSSDDVVSRDRPVRIAVLLVQNDKTEAVRVAGPVRAAVRAAFAHPKLATALQTLQMDADRLVNRIVSRWGRPGHEDEAHQEWLKSNGSMTVRWWIDPEDVLSPTVKRALSALDKRCPPVPREFVVSGELE